VFLSISNYFCKLLFISSLLYNNSLITTMITLSDNTILVVGGG
jgi:hypothetical protein